MDFLNYVLSNWSAISAVILFIISTIATVKKLKLNAHDSAKAIANSLMLGFEKRALEILNTTDGKAKFNEVVSMGYDKFPANVRFFISKPLFEQLVQSIHDEAIKLVESNIPKTGLATKVTAPDVLVPSGNLNGNVIAKSVAVSGTPSTVVSQEALQAYVAQLPITTTTNSAISESGIVANTIVAPEVIAQPTTLL